MINGRPSPVFRRIDAKGIILLKAQAVLLRGRLCLPVVEKNQGFDDLNFLRVV